MALFVPRTHTPLQLPLWPKWQTWHLPFVGADADAADGLGDGSTSHSHILLPKSTRTGENLTVNGKR